jgi:hypothetical protein
MSILKFAIMIIAVSFFIQNNYPRSQNNGFVTVKGKKILLPNGKELLLKGINIGNWLELEGYMFKFKRAESSRKIYELFNEIIGPTKAAKFWNEYRKNYITEKDIEFIKEQGFNSIRIPFDYKLFSGIDFSSKCLKPGFKLLKDVIGWCHKNKIYAILDMHCAPGGQTGANIDDSWGYPYLYGDKESEELTIKIWKEIADRYKEEKYVLGYDLLNEPIAPYLDYERLNRALEPLYIRITNAIRSVDRNHIIIIGGAQWDTNFKIFGKPFDSKIIYTFHKYWCDTSQSVIKEYLEFRDRYDVPILLGESGENKMQWVDSFRRLMEENNIGWCFWTFKRLDSDRCIVSITQPEGYDELIRYADTNRQTFEEIRNALPDRNIIEKVVSNYLKYIKLKNCHINEKYIVALGLKLH